MTSTKETETFAGEENQRVKLLDYGWQLKKRGLSEVTIKHRTKQLVVLLKKGADLSKPDSVETVIATENFSPATKSQLVVAYRSYTKTFNILWVPIRVKYESRQPFIPLESEIDQLIAGCGKRTATFLQTLKDTAARTGEVAKVKWIDINEANNSIRINNPEKGSRSRTIKVSSKTIAMLKAMPKKYGEYVFNPKSGTLEDSFKRSRDKLALKLKNPRLKLIHFHTMRHWKATMEYHRTRDILYVQRLLGHKRIENTEIYTHLIEFDSEEYHSAIAKTVDEAKGLIESGFEYVCDMQDIKLFRKRK